MFAGNLGIIIGKECSISKSSVGCMLNIHINSGYNAGSSWDNSTPTIENCGPKKILSAILRTYCCHIISYNYKLIIWLWHKIWVTGLVKTTKSPNLWYGPNCSQLQIVTWISNNKAHPPPNGIQAIWVRLVFDQPTTEMEWDLILSCLDY